MIGSFNFTLGPQDSSRSNYPQNLNNIFGALKEQYINEEDKQNGGASQDYKNFQLAGSEDDKELDIQVILDSLAEADINSVDVCPGS